MTDALLKDAHTLHQAGKLAEAARLYGEILKSQPKRFDVLYALGLAHLQRGDFAAAASTLSEAIGINENAPEAHMVRGVAFSQLGRHEEALSAYDRAAALKPGDAAVWNNRGNALLQLGRFSEAAESYARALSLRPEHPDGWRHRGMALALMDRPEEALECVDKALAIDPKLADALVDRAQLLMRLQRHEEAETAFAKANEVRPGQADLHYNHANTLSILKRYDDAIAEAHTALTIDPNYPYARGILMHSMLQSCDWHRLEEEKKNIADAVKRRQRVVSPFNHKAISDSPEEQLACARAWVANEKPAGITPYIHTKRARDRIRLAYVSADFNASAVATIMAGIFKKHDKDRFETFAISFGNPVPTPMRARLEAAFDRFIDVRTKSDMEIATLIYDAEIDIAVDLMGYTGECRSWILARKPAPVQVNFLGFPGTMGADHIDYIVADETVIPADAQRHYTEKIAYLPDSYLPGGARDIATRPSRDAAGLPEEGFVFASFNNAYKFAPAMFVVWMRLLRGVPESVLWLPKSEPTTMANLAKEAEARGVSAKRLIFATALPAREDHLARLSLADLFLDTLPYNAHSTAIDALIAGVPVLTTPGNGFQSRVAASVLKAAGMSELIAPDIHEYEQMALRFAQERDTLNTMRTKLLQSHETAPLFDTDRFTRHLEAGFQLMWERHTQGLAPETFAVPPS